MASKYMTFKILAFISVFIVYFSYIYYCMTVNLYCYKITPTVMEITPHSKLFKAYLKKFNKHYEGEEFHQRLEYFMENLREIERQNRDGGNGRHGLNKNSDLSKDEFKNRLFLDTNYMNSNCDNKQKPCNTHPVIPFDNNEPIANQLNWHDRGVVGPVLDQKNCLACWAFSIVGVMESMMAIQRNESFITRLSIQELIDCSRKYKHTNGCAGGNAELAIDYLCSYGVPLGTEQQIPLANPPSNGVCQMPSSGVKISWMAVECDVPADKIVEIIARHGPVVAAVNANNWINYLDEIIQWNCKGDDWSLIKHVVQIVGYDKSGEIPYFIIRNSWGRDWGIKGYLKIAMVIVTKYTRSSAGYPGRWCWPNKNGGLILEYFSPIELMDEMYAKSKIMVRLTENDFGTFNNEKVKQYTWKTDSGFSLSAISYGAIVQSIKVPDKNGIIADVVLGFDDLDGYVKRNSPYLGAAVGRCANRIGKATFTIDGVKYDLAKNVGENHLHGGIVGFDKKNWQTTVLGTKVIFSYLSKDGEEGYPGDLLTNITYEVKDDNSFHMEFVSRTTKKTVVNLTNHSYFNLAGHDTGAEELYNHCVTINADRITETDADSIPTGRFLKVGGTPYDLRVPKRIGDVINSANNLYDDNFCVSTFGNKDLNFVSRVTHPSGRYLDLYSNQPGVQLYTANFLPSPEDQALIGKGGEGYRRHGAFCLETQNYPDAIHHDNFPSPVLVPGDNYVHKVVYCFGFEKGEPRVVSA